MPDGRSRPPGAVEILKARTERKLMSEKTAKKQRTGGTKESVTPHIGIVYLVG
jgi:hypothetical protein